VAKVKWVRGIDEHRTLVNLDQVGTIEIRQPDEARFYVAAVTAGNVVPLAEFRSEAEARQALEAVAKSLSAPFASVLF
jgi:hypothetical protein